MLFIIARIFLICLSQTPPWWLAVGEFTLYTILFSVRYFFSLLSFMVSKSFSCWFLPPRKLVPPSQNMVATDPRMDSNRLKAWRKLSADKSSSSSMCKALVYKHVNRTPHLLITDRRSLTSKGPKVSIPIWVNGGLGGFASFFW